MYLHLELLPFWTIFPHLVALCLFSRIKLLLPVFFPSGFLLCYWKGLFIPPLEPNLMFALLCWPYDSQRCSCQFGSNGSHLFIAVLLPRTSTCYQRIWSFLVDTTGPATCLYPGYSGPFLGACLPWRGSISTQPVLQATQPYYQEPHSNLWSAQCHSWKYCWCPHGQAGKGTSLKSEWALEVSLISWMWVPRR